MVNGGFQATNSFATNKNETYQKQQPSKVVRRTNKKQIDLNITDQSSGSSASSSSNNNKILQVDLNSEDNFYKEIMNDQIGSSTVGDSLMVNSRDFVPRKKDTPCKRIAHIASEVGIRIVLFVIFLKIERTDPFVRKIQPEEWWLYKNPITADYIPALWLLPAAFFLPAFVALIHYIFTKDSEDFSQANLASSLAIILNGLTTGILKITIGRPRPDYYYRCYPNGTEEFGECTGDQYAIFEGRKSFPSGHSSFAFTAFGFVFFYLSAKLHVFSDKGRGQSWRIVTVLLPLYLALLVAISRTCDYHHHWQDVTAGAAIGLIITYFCYRQYYPSIFSPYAHRPYKSQKYKPGSPQRLNSGPNQTVRKPHSEAHESTPLVEDVDENEHKWI